MVLTFIISRAEKHLRMNSCWMLWRLSFRTVSPQGHLEVCHCVMWLKSWSSLLSAADTEHVNQSGFEDSLCELCVCVCVFDRSVWVVSRWVGSGIPLPPAAAAQLRPPGTQTHTHTHSCNHTHKELRGIRWVRRRKIERKLEDCSKRTVNIERWMGGWKETERIKVPQLQRPLLDVSRWRSESRSPIYILQEQ